MQENGAEPEADLSENSDSGATGSGGYVPFSEPESEEEAAIDS